MMRARSWRRPFAITLRAFGPESVAALGQPPRLGPRAVSVRSGDDFRHGSGMLELFVPSTRCARARSLFDEVVVRSAVGLVARQNGPVARSPRSSIASIRKRAGALPEIAFQIRPLPETRQSNYKRLCHECSGLPSSLAHQACYPHHNAGGVRSPGHWDACRGDATQTALPWHHAGLFV